MRKYIKIIFKEFVYGGHLLSVGGSCIVFSVIGILNLPINFFIILIPYLSSQVVYSYNHLKEVDEDSTTNPERSLYLANKVGVIRALILLYLSILTIVLLFTNLQTLIFAYTVVIGGVLYTNKFKFISKHSFPGFKNVYTSFFWASSVFLIPFFYELNINKALILLFIFVFLRWIVNSTFFDIKDIKSDKKSKVKSIPILIGKEKTLNLLHFINLLSVLPIILGVQYAIIPAFALPMVTLALYSWAYLFYSKGITDNKLRTLSYIVVDAEYFFWPILILVGKILIK